MPPRVAILLTTYNGAEYVAEQVNSILGQEGCAVTIFASDDHSTDATLSVLSSISDRHPGKLLIRKPQAKCGSAGKNFYSLIGEIDSTQYDFFAFADQDDIWDTGHLQLSIEEMARSQTVGVSCNVTAFWDDGTKRLYRKNQPQRKLDFLFESPGPGCTYVLAKPFFQTIQQVVRNEPELVSRVFHHDWLIYALARSRGEKWVIREQPTLLYRQHAGNETGGRYGYKGIAARWRKINRGWFREQILAVVAVLAACGLQPSPKVVEQVQRGSFSDRLGLASQVGNFRRSAFDKIFLSFMFASGIFWRGKGSTEAKRNLPPVPKPVTGSVRL